MNDSRAESRRSARIIALAISTVMFMEGLDSSIVVTSIPRIAADLHAPAVQTSVIVSAYFLALAVMLPISGWLADRFGGRRVFCVAILAFVGASLLCALAPTLGWLATGRVGQGACAALMTPVARVILARSTEKSELIRVMNYTIVPGIAGQALGPAVGGFVTTYASWRWNFGFSAPLGLLGIVAALAVLPRTPPAPFRPLDVLGCTLLGTTAIAMQAGFGAVERANYSLAFGAILAGVLALMAYIGHARRSRTPLIDLDLFRIRSFRVTVWIGAVTRLGLYAAQILIPLLLQVALGFDAFHAGLFAFVSVCGTFIMRPLLSVVLRRFGFRRVLSAAGGAAALMLAGFGFAPRDAWLPALALYVLAFGVVRSMLFSSLASLAYADVDPSRMPMSNAVSTLSQRLSMSFGISLGALALSLGAHGTTADRTAFIAAFCSAAAVTAVGATGLVLFLREDDGWSVAGRIPPDAPPDVPR